MPEAYLKPTDFPAVRSDRFFVVKHNPKSRTNPVTVELRESMAEGKRLESFSRLLGVEYTIADKKRIVAAAELIDARVGRIDEVVGVY